MRRLTRVLAISILLGAILLATPRAQTMDFADYAKWSIHVSEISVTLEEVRVALSDIKQPAKTKKAFFKLGNIARRLQSWAEEVTPPNATFSAPHKHLKNAFYYQHSAFLMATSGNFKLSNFYAEQSTKEWKAAAEALPKL